MMLLKSLSGFAQARHLMNKDPRSLRVTTVETDMFIWKSTV